MTGLPPTRVEERTGLSSGDCATLCCALCNEYFCVGERVDQYVMDDGFTFLLCPTCSPQLTVVPGAFLLEGDVEAED